MSSTYGENLRLTIFGQSHSPAIGMTLEGFPAGFAVDPEALQRFLRRRAPGQSELSTPRKEADRPEFLSGLFAGRTCGAPIAVILRNTNILPGDYAGLQNTPRPGHADYTAQIKYFGFQDPTGGGHFSGRLTAPLCVAGGLCLQYLRQQGVEILSRIASIGGISDEGQLVTSTADKPFPTVSDARGEEMRRAILQAKAEGDSLGGVVECAVLGLPAGLGDPMFGGMENRLAAILFGIPAVKGVEFGAGFGASRLRGSENNDAFRVEDGRIVTETNRAGGILGGITTGMPLTLRVGIKPTPSIGRPQKTVSLARMENTELTIRGRHDPCIAHRAVPVVDAVTACVLLDLLLEEHHGTF